MRLLLIDLENVMPDVEEIKRLNGYRIIVVHGKHQFKVVERFSKLDKQNLHFEEALPGRNHADFMLCCVLGEQVSNGYKNVAILSKDKGFHAVTAFAATRNVSCSFVGSLQEILPVDDVKSIAASALPEDAESAIMAAVSLPAAIVVKRKKASPANRLCAFVKKQRPSKITKLHNSIRAFFGSAADVDVEKVVDVLSRNGVLRVVGEGAVMWAA